MKDITAIRAAALLLLVCAALSACGKKDGAAGEQPSLPAETSVLQEERTGKVVASPSGTAYRIVRGEGADENEKNAMAALKSAIVDATGVLIPSDDDWLNTWQTVAEVRSDHEILVGRTNRPETDEAQVLLDGADGERNFVIAQFGEHIALLGSTSYGTLLAADYFTEHFVDGERIVLPEDALPVLVPYEEQESVFDSADYPNRMTFFSPAEGRVGDVIPIYHDGQYLLFFLHAGTAKWAYTTTRDFVNFSDTVELQDFGGTGDVLFVDGKWHLFAAFGNDSGEQIIRHYTGTELSELKKDGADIRADPTRYASWAWRDPRVWYDESLGKYRMLVCTNEVGDGRSERNGCVAWLSSPNLYEWELGGTFFRSSYYQGSNECPDTFKMGDWYYLVYSDCTFGKRTYYVKSKSPDGPWEIPDHDTFDSLFFYAAKTASDGENRYLFGWAGDRADERFTMKPGESYGADFAAIRYAGDMIVHRLAQKENGDLVCLPVESVKASFTKPSVNKMTPVSGDWSLSDDLSAASTSSSGMASLVMQSMKSRFLLTFKLRVDAKEAGIGLHVPSSLIDMGTYVCIDRQGSRLRTRSGALTGEGGYYFPYECELEQPIRFDPDRTYDVTVIGDGQIMAVYLEGECALTIRSTGSTGLNLALFCYAGTAEFSEIEMKTLPSR